MTLASIWKLKCPALSHEARLGMNLLRVPDYHPFWRFTVWTFNPMRARLSNRSRVILALSSNQSPRAAPLMPHWTNFATQSVEGQYYGWHHGHCWFDLRQVIALMLRLRMDWPPFTVSLSTWVNTDRFFRASWSGRPDCTVQVTRYAWFAHPRYECPGRQATVEGSGHARAFMEKWGWVTRQRSNSQLWASIPSSADFDEPKNHHTKKVG